MTTTPTTSKPTGPNGQLPRANTDGYSWANPYGGAWGIAGNWTDVTTNTAPTAPPGAANAASIVGGTNGTFTNVTGTGAAAKLSIGNDVLLWGTVTVAGPVTLGDAADLRYLSDDLELDGGARLTAGSLVVNGGTVLVGNASTLVASGAAMLASGFLAATNGGSVRLGALIVGGGSYGVADDGLAVDGNSSIEVGTTGGAAAGAVTIDSGRSAAVSGTIDGNLEVNGTLGVQAGGALSIDVSDPFGTARGIGGSGTLVMSEQSQLTLGVADGAAIRFAGPSGGLVLQALPSGEISGFAAGDVIQVDGLATGLSYAQTSADVATLTLTKGGQRVGRLRLAGDYAGSLFHLSVGSNGVGLITLQTIGVAPVQPSLIVGTVGIDTLYAAADGQTLTGLGGGDTLQGGSFTGIDFKDSGADLNGSTITSFNTSDVIDLTDVRADRASVTYAPGGNQLLVTDGTHAATIGLAFDGGAPTGSFTTGTDGGGGTDVRYVAVNTDAYSFGSAFGGYGSASNWRDVTTGAAATVAPSRGNAVTIAGGAGYTDVTGNGAAGSVATSGDVLLWGGLAVGGDVAGVSGDLVQAGALALDGGASLTLAGAASVGGVVELGGGSRFTAAGGIMFAADGASLLATDGSSARFSGASGGSATSVISVDATSSVELGSAGGSATGALTIDGGVTADLAGSIYGNVVVNGTIAVANNAALTIMPVGGAVPLIDGAGMLQIANGATLSLAAADSAAVQFAANSGGGTPETLALVGNQPTGPISGFGTGDVISLGRVVTGFAYEQTGSEAGTLSLFDGAATVGTLSLVGRYDAGRFLLSPAGLSSTITYAPAPDTAPGGQISGNGDGYNWTNTSGGVWSNAANWIDTTSPATTTAAPGAGNPVSVYDNLGDAKAQIISGTGSAATLTVYANTVFTGAISVAGGFEVDSAASVSLENGATLRASGLYIATGASPSLLVAGGSALTAGGPSGSNTLGNISVVGGSTVQVIGSTNQGMSGTIAVDGTSSFEFGAGGNAAAGTVTVDSGQPNENVPQLDGTIAANLVLNGDLSLYAFLGSTYRGTIEGFGGTVGSITGTGTIVLSNAYSIGTTLVLDAFDSAAIAFSTDASIRGFGPSTLEVKGPLPTGTISGFGANGDVIRVDRTVTGARFDQTTSSLGTLTLTDGGATVGTLLFAGLYDGSRFHVDVDPATGFGTITLQTASGAAGTGPASAGTDAYTWAGASGGDWATAANWHATTPGAAASVPGSGDAVTIDSYPGPGNKYETVGGNGSAASLTISDNLMLTGTLGVTGWLGVGPGLALDAGAKLTAGSAAVSGTLEVGDGSTAAIAGSAVVSGGALLALDGGRVQVGGLIGNGGATLAVDADSTFKIGDPAIALAGALTQAAGATAALTGSIYGNVAAGGTLAVAGGGALFIDMSGTVEADPYAAAPTIGGTGTLSITEGGTLGLGAADSAAIRFAGPDATLTLAKLPTATLTGFAIGDQIQIDQAVTSLKYRQVTPDSGTLTLTNGAMTVGALKLAGSYGGGTAFHLDAAANGDAAVITLQSLGVPPTQPTLIQGTAAADALTATTDGQTVAGLGGADTLSGGGFTGINFKDLTANLNGCAVQNFVTSDVLDFTDMKAGSTTAHYAGGTLSVTDGTHTAALAIGFLRPPATGAITVSSDGGSGTKLAWS